MKQIINWGILGPGNIAHQFVKGLQTLADARVVAVGSCNKAKASAFAQQYGIPRVYGSYTE